MEEMRKSEGKREKELLRKLINERDGLWVSHTYTCVHEQHTDLHSKCRFILKLRAVCLWIERVIPTFSSLLSSPTSHA